MRQYTARQGHCKRQARVRTSRLADGRQRLTPASQPLRSSSVAAAAAALGVLPLLPTRTVVERACRIAPQMTPRRPTNNREPCSTCVCVCVCVQLVSPMRCACRPETSCDEAARVPALWLEFAPFGWQGIGMRRDCQSALVKLSTGSAPTACF